MYKIRFRRMYCLIYEGLIENYNKHEYGIEIDGNPNKLKMERKSENI